MTLIAFATYGSDRAEFITDTAHYTRMVSKLGHCTKHTLLTHLDAALLAQGDHAFNLRARTVLQEASGDVETFDDLTNWAPGVLNELWQDCRKNVPMMENPQATIFLLGWSDRAAKFVAWGHASEHSFEPFKVPGLWVTPAPWTMRPSQVELERVAQSEHDDPDVQEALDLWRTKPPRPAPRTPTEWAQLAIETREQRALLTTTARVIVAGDVFHTVLERGSARTARIHRFDDTGDEFQWMLRGTDHPVALTLACGCGSGRPFGDCCHSLDPRHTSA